MLDREDLGRLVRAVWVECVCELPNPKPSNLLPWAELDEWNKEVDRKIGERVVEHVFGWQRSRLVFAIAHSASNKAMCDDKHGHRFIVQWIEGGSLHLWRFEDSGDTCYESDHRSYDSLRVLYDVDPIEEIWVAL